LKEFLIVKVVSTCDFGQEQSGNFYDVKYFVGLNYFCPI
jgi:hypothetical protein